MKNKFLFSALLMASSLAFANNTNTTSENKTGSSRTCYVRPCKITSYDLGNGNTVEYKECGEWITVPCEKKEKEEPKNQI